MKKRSFYKNSLFLKIFLTSLICLIVPMLITLVYTSYTTSNALETEARNSLSSMANEKNKQFKSVFDSQFQLSEAMVSELFMIEFFEELNETNLVDQEKVEIIAQNLAERVNSSNGLYENLFFSYEDKVFIDGIGGNSVGHVFDKELESYYFEQLENPGVSASDYMYSPITGRPVITISNSIMDQQTGEILSVLVIAVDINKLTEVLVATDSVEERNTMILDPSGLVIASSQADLALNLNFSEQAGGISDLFEKMQEAQSGYGAFTLNDQEKMGTFVENEENQLTILTYTPVEKYMGSVQGLQSNIIIVMLLSIVFAAIVIFIVLRRMVKPIGIVSKSAQRIAKGDLTIDPIELNTKDEVGELAHSFNQMLTNLQTMIHQVSTTSESVAASAEELSASSEQSTRVTEQVTEAIQAVAVGAVDQSDNVLQSADLLRDVTASVQQVTANAQQVVTAANTTSEKAREGATIIDSSLSQIETTNDEIQQVAEKIKQLEVRSKEIGQIIGVITQISDQTNLLALNAAIEAARAGEHGKGFAVVANEVRNLAEQSKNSSEQITSLITAILKETEETVQSMDETVKQSSKGIEAIKTVEHTFDDIQQSVDYVTGQIQEVSTASELIQSSIKRISSSVEQITTISSETASKTQQVSVSMEEQAASSKEVTSATLSLAKLAEQLQGSIQHFKLK